MEKVIAFLERNVQWLVLGLAIVWLLYMAWSYVITPPAVVTIGEKRLMPGEVDRFTATGVSEQLQVAMADSRVPVLDVPEYTESWLAQMSWANSPTVAMADAWLTSKAGALSLPGRERRPAGGTGTVAAATGEQQPELQPVTALIEPPAPVPVASLQVGRSVVAKGSAASPTRGMSNARTTSGGGDEELWVTAAFQIPMDQLRSAFRRANLPERVANTAFIDVDLIREERLPDGSWGGGTVVKPVAGGAEVMAYPQGGNRTAEAAYLSWAVGNPELVLRPPFYDVLRGRQWQRPSVDGSIAGFDPATFTGDLDSLTPDQRRQVLEARRTRTAQTAGQPQQPRTAAEMRRGPASFGPTGGMPFGPGMFGQQGGRRRSGSTSGTRRPRYAPEDPGRAVYYQSSQRQNRMSGPTGPMMPDISRFIEQAMRNAGRGGGGAAGGNRRTGAAARPGMPALPTRITPTAVPDELPGGEFNPVEWDGATKMLVWAHDDSVQDGKTYRYKLRYRIKNPVYQAPGLAPSPEAAAQLALVSPESAWTRSVDVPQPTNFFIASGRTPGQDRIRVEVFVWNDGTQTSQQFDLAPGDTVGRDTATARYSTDWVLVEVAENDDVVMANAKTGEVLIRNYRRDQSDPLYRQLKQEVSDARQTAASAR